MTINDIKEEILRAIEAQRIVIIKGATGCGKTTQIPRLIYEAGKNETNIVVTQPRRIAAISIAKRVATEMNVPLGTVVGYQVGLEKEKHEKTRILYVTTGILLEKLIKSKDMREFTHYIIDEIHEREQDMDFVMIVARKFLNTTSKETKLILMSATMDTKKFQNYLVTYYNQREFEPRILDIDEPTPFKLYTWFLDDVLHKKSMVFKGMKLLPFVPDAPSISDDIYRAAARIIQELDKSDPVPISEEETSLGKPAVLVFLPGIHEIETFEKKLMEMSSESTTPLWIKPLHSSITTDEQQDIFKNPPEPSMRKVILSTNIAESSVTVPDIIYVIDFCLTKCQVIDRNTNCSSLALAWASKNSLTQRAGRVGRTSVGYVYRLISKRFYENELEQEAVPEIVRCPLESLVLKAKILDIGPPKEILDEAMDPPDLGNIYQAVANLKEIGALLLYNGDEYDPTDGDITLMGKVLAYLPLDVRLGKLIYLGNVFGVTEECIIMACAMANKNIFSTPYGKSLEAYDRKLWWAKSSCSDCFAYLNAYNAWRRQTMEGYLNTYKKEYDWARANFLQLNALRELAAMEHDIQRRLMHHNLFNFEKETQVPTYNKDLKGDERSFFLKLAIAAAFYPNYFVHGCQIGRNEEKQAINTLGGHDPFSSVYFLGLPQNQPLMIYKGAVKKLLSRITDRLDVNVDNGTKAYVTFRRPLSKHEVGAIPGKVEMGVYRAIKMRHTGSKFSIPNLRADEATDVYNQYLKQNKYEDDTELRRQLDKLIWPWRKDDKKFIGDKLEIKISYVDSPNRFWIQSSMECASTMLISITKILNHKGCLIDLPKDADLAIGSIYVAPYIDGENVSIDGENVSFHRCRIMAKNFNKFRFQKEDVYSIHFIDYGNSCEMKVNQIYDIHPEVKENFFIDKLPDLAVECSLVKVQPIDDKAINESSQGKWREAATKILKTIEYIPTYAKVYSVVNDVLRVKILHPNKKDSPYQFENTINYRLIKLGHALRADEDYRSLSSREELKLIRQVDRTSIEKYKISTNAAENLTFYDLKLSGSGEAFLKGPYSPLEMKLSSMTQATASKQVNIEKNSVNSVLLNTNPSDPKDRMLVAAYVGANPIGTRLNLMHTTMMPNIAALPMLCCLLFSPMVELRCNPTFTRYCGAVCGLGYDRMGRSLFPANDVEVVFDHEISDSNLVLINRARYWLNKVVNPSQTGRNSDENLKDILLHCTKKLKEYFRILFLENQYELQEPYFTLNSYHWALNDYDRLRDPCPQPNVEKHPADDHINVYRLIWGIWRSGNIEEETKAILKNLKMLKDFSKNYLPQASFDCELCQVMLENPTVAKTHMKEPEHRLRSRRYLQKSDEVP